MKLLNFTIIKLTTCVIIGIIIACFSQIPLILSLQLTVISLAVLSVLYIVARKQFIKTIWFGLSSFITMILIGILVTNFHNEKHFPNHYTHQISNEKGKQFLVYGFEAILKIFTKFMYKKCIGIVFGCCRRQCRHAT